MILKKIDPKIR
jgi:alpha-glucan, water dikinase